MDGKEKLMALAAYPGVTLKAARTRRDEAREPIAKDIDPSAARKATKTAGIDTFEAITPEWFGRNPTKWVPAHAEKIIRRFEVDVFPWIGPRPTGGITAPDLLAVVRRIEAWGGTGNRP
nr:integrase arm-type DNA-binding domain-containing protein [uncultured Thiodictyon sp.]